VRPKTNKIGKSNKTLVDGKETNATAQISNQPQPSRWFADFLTLVAFGRENGPTTPSPLDGIPPKIPHLLLGCSKEVFGLPLMDLLFCSKEFTKLVESKYDGSIPARCVEMDSLNHWNILASSKFSSVLGHELKWITSAASSQRQQRKEVKKD